MLNLKHVSLSSIKQALKFERAQDVQDEYKNGELRRMHRLSTLLREWQEREEQTYILYPDWAQYSFRFVFEENKKRVYHGGVVCHGVGETLTVEICPKSGIYWAVHT